MRKVYSNIRGTSDLDVSASLAFRYLEKKAREIFKIFAYEEIILPLLEERDLFIKGVGATTDIVERQMFKIEGKDIVLRPEGTAQVVRYYIQDSLHKKNNFYKFFYTGPMFRGERPQKGRLRQFHHIGAEAIGSDNTYLDAEIIDLSLKILDNIGITNKDLRINTLGCSSDKIKFSHYLKDALNSNRKDLCDDCGRRLEKNPLRVLDCKKQQCKNVRDSLTLKQEHLCADCKNQFKDLLSILDSMGIKYIYSPYLVRGLDYYTNTVFEITSEELGAQDALGAGGRYNNLVKFLGGPDVPAIGFALGVERILLVLNGAEEEQKIDVFIAVASNSLSKAAFDVLKKLRREGLNCDYDYCGKSLKGQLRYAQKKKARFVVIIGEEEWKDKVVLLKDMQKSTQETVTQEALISKIRDSKGEQPDVLDLGNRREFNIN